jgi:ABC-type branched-subunit amino acid transport system substrate-binding protein
MNKTTIMSKKTAIVNYSLFALALTFSLASCDLFKKAETTAPKRDTKVDPRDANQPQGSGKVSNVDTIHWKTDNRSRPPISTGQAPPSPVIVTDNSNNQGNPNFPQDNNTNSGTPIDNTGGKPLTKSAYVINMLLPFSSDKFVESSGTNPAKGQFALDFYAGAKMALDTLGTLPLNLTVNVMDSKDGFMATSGRYGFDKADVIIGPIEKDNVIQAMAYSTRNNVTVVSPYFPTGDVDGVNPNFVQLKPSLRTHCYNIVRNIISKYPGASVVMAARSKENEVSRFAYFQEAEKIYSAAKFEEWKIEDDISFNPEPYIEKTGTTVLIVPSWNEAFVTSFLRKLNASPYKNQIVVYGMPQWMDFSTSLNGMYESLKVHVSSSTYIDNNSGEIKYFRNKFMSKYGKLPNPDAVLGYDCTLYVGKMMIQYGSKFPYFLDREQQNVLHTKFQFNPVFRNVNNDAGSNVAKYENGYVNILRFQGNNFRLDE